MKGSYSKCVYIPVPLSSSEIHFQKYHFFVFTMARKGIRGERRDFIQCIRLPVQGEMIAFFRK